MAADLELGLICDADQESLHVFLQLTSFDGQLDRNTFLRKAITIHREALRLARDETAYSARLTDMVYTAPKIAEYYRAAVLAAHPEPVHFRVHVNGPAWLHAVRWELLRAPGADAGPIAVTGNVLFSRYLSNEDWSPVSARSRRGNRALVVVAAPSNLAEYGLAPISRSDELARARQALTGYQIDVLERPSLQNLAARLDSAQFEVLYLVAHGKLTEDVPYLVLEHADGTYERIDARRLVEQIQGLDHKPTLAVLLSCQSAAAGEESTSADSGALAGLGPRLAGAGIPAVVAMQSNVTMTTAQTFVTRFFEAFGESPLIDRAMAKARLAVRGRRDWWVPVLYSRLRSGRAYRPPVHTSDNVNWDDLSLLLDVGRVTPILGSGLADEILGSRSEIAQRWVRRWQMPIVEHGQSNLAQVAQFMSVGRGSRAVRAYFADHLMTDLRERADGAAEGDPFSALPSALLNAADPVPVILEVGRRMRVRDPDDPHRVAAALPAPVFVTTAWTGLLQEAMVEHGKQPLTMCFPWSDLADWVDADGRDVATWPAPTVDRPWVCHLFGALDRPESLVLTEDDYFAWLTAWIEKRPLLSRKLSPLAVALAMRSLLFVGYQLRELDFQMLHQGIKTFGGRGLLDDRMHVGVQLMPDMDVIEPQAAQRYLESTLDTVNLFWGDTRSFLAELRKRTGLIT